MQKESLLFFSFPSDKDSKLVSLGSSKNFGAAKITKKGGQNKRIVQLFILRFDTTTERPIDSSSTPKMMASDNGVGISMGDKFK